MLLSLVAATWGPSLANGFASDDLDLIVARHYALGDWAHYFQSDLWTDATASGYYRPLMSLSLALDEALWGKSAVGAHLQSLWWHLMATAGVYALARELVPFGRALVAGAIFGLHAVQSEAVCFVSARNDPMSAALVVWGIVLGQHSGSGSGTPPWRFLAAWALLSLAPFAKETALAGPLLFVGLAWARRESLVRPAIMGACAWATWGAIRFGWGPSALDPVPDGGWLTVASKLGDIVQVYLSKLWVPWPLSDSETVVYVDRPALSVAIVIGVSTALLAWVLRRGGRVAWVAVLFALAAFLPSWVAIAARYLIAERYLTLPLAGLAVAVASVLPSDPRKLATALPVILVWILCAEARIPDWQDDLHLTESAVAATPSPYASAWMGRALVDAGHPETALPWFEEALTAPVPYCAAASDPVYAAIGAGQPNEAMRLARVAWDAKCGADPLFRGAWAEAALASGDFAMAARILTPPPACDASNATPLAVVLLVSGQPGMAQPCLELLKDPSRRTRVDAMVERFQGAARP